MIRVLVWRLFFEILHLVRAVFGPGRPRVLYFAFGANLDPQVLARRKIKVFGEREFILENFELRFSHQGPYQGMGYASIEANADALTYGKLYTISRLDALRLDFYEGAWFIRRYRKIKHHQDGVSFYFYQTSSPRSGLRPTQDYLSKMTRGFALLGNVPGQYLDWLKSHGAIENLVVSDDVGFCFRVRDTWPKFLAKAARKYDQFIVGIFATYIRDYSLTARLINHQPPGDRLIVTPDTKAKESVFALVARLRTTNALQNTSTLRQLEKQLEPFTSIGEVNAFCQDISRVLAGDKADFARTRSVNVSGPSGLLIGFLSAPYNKNLGLECLLYNDCSVPQEIADTFPSVARPIKVHKYSQGFKSDLAVAIFPENFVHAGEIPTEARSFYFIDKFARRCKEKTIPFLRSTTTLRSLTLLKTATDEQIEAAASLWVYLHEHFHRQGVLPLPKALRLKSSRSTAGLEELRVDLLAMLACSADIVRRNCDAAMLEEFILAERLFRYGVERCPNADYDSRGAHVFYRYLESAGAISESADMIEVDMIEYRKLAATLSRDIAALEQQIMEKSFTEAKEILAEYVKDVAGFDPATKLFPRGRFYSSALEGRG